MQHACYTEAVSINHAELKSTKLKNKASMQW